MAARATQAAVMNPGVPTAVSLSVLKHGPWYRGPPYERTLILSCDGICTMDPKHQARRTNSWTWADVISFSVDACNTNVASILLRQGLPWNGIEELRLQLSTSTDLDDLSRFFDSQLRPAAMLITSMVEAADSSTALVRGSVAVVTSTSLSIVYAHASTSTSIEMEVGTSAEALGRLEARTQQRLLQAKQDEVRAQVQAQARALTQAHAKAQLKAQLNAPSGMLAVVSQGHSQARTAGHASRTMHASQSQSPHQKDQGGCDYRQAPEPPPRREAPEPPPRREAPEPPPRRGRASPST